MCDGWGQICFLAIFTLGRQQCPTPASWLQKPGAIFVELACRSCFCTGPLQVFWFLQCAKDMLNGKLIGYCKLLLLQVGENRIREATVNRNVKGRMEVVWWVLHGQRGCWRACWCARWFWLHDLMDQKYTAWQHYNSNKTDAKYHLMIVT